MGRAIKVVILIGMLLGLAYTGACIYANAFQGNPKSGPPVPESKDAPYLVTIQSTGNVYLASKYEQLGSVYILKGYYELVGKEFIYHSKDLILDEKIYGKIIIKARPPSTPTKTGG